MGVNSTAQAEGCLSDFIFGPSAYQSGNFYTSDAMPHGMEHFVSNHKPVGLQSAFRPLQQDSSLTCGQYPRWSFESNDSVDSEGVTDLHGAHGHPNLHVQMPIDQPCHTRTHQTTSTSEPHLDSGQETITNFVCYEHGCNGRFFASGSNLRRHQRERARVARMLFCPLCGASFFRKWTRDRHVAKLSCKTWTLSSAKCS